MKPHLLVMLLLAIPPLISSILACESAAKSDDLPASAKSGSLAKDAPVPATGSSCAKPATATAKPAAAPTRSGTSHTTPSLVRAWDIM